MRGSDPFEGKVEGTAAAETETASDAESTYEHEDIPTLPEQEEGWEDDAAEVFGWAPRHGQRA